MSDLIKREDAIEAVWKPQVKPNELIFDALKRAIESEINNLPSAHRPRGEWIPCSERLPEPGSWAIWCSIKGIIQVARWKEDAIDHFFPDQGFFDLEDAVAWMPLPEPWKGAENNKECHKPQSLYYRAFCEEREDSAYCDGCEFWY